MWQHQYTRICLQCGRPEFDFWVGKIPWRRERLTTPVFWPREFYGLYSPWDRKESDTTEQLSLSESLYILIFKKMLLSCCFYLIDGGFAQLMSESESELKTKK